MRIDLGKDIATSESSQQVRTSYLGVSEAPTIFVRVLNKSAVYIARETCDAPNFGITLEHELQDAFAVYVLLRNSYGRTDLWLNGKRYPREHSAQGAIVAYPHDQRWRANMREPFDCIHIHLPRSVLNDIADEIGVQRIGTLHLPPSDNTFDPVVFGLVTSLLPALENVAHASMLFIESVTLALSVHLCQRYGGMSVDARSMHGGLAPWQLKRAKEMLLEKIDGEISLEELANACVVSRSHFARSFKMSVGQAPHQWLRHQRVQKAKQLLAHADTSPFEIALLCGFTDQSHLMMGVQKGRRRHAGSISSGARKTPPGLGAAPAQHQRALAYPFPHTPRHLAPQWVCTQASISAFSFNRSFPVIPVIRKLLVPKLALPYNDEDACTTTATSVPQ